MLVTLGCELGAWATLKPGTGTSDAQKPTSSFPGGDVNRKGGSGAGSVIQSIDLASSNITIMLVQITALSLIPRTYKEIMRNDTASLGNCHLMESLIFWMGV